MSLLRKMISTVIDVCAAVVATWHIVRFQALSSLGMATFQQASEAVSAVSMFFGYRVRERFYRRLLEQCGERLEINYGTILSERETRLGNDIWIGPCGYVDLCTIEDQVLIGPHVCILAGGAHHRMDRIDLPIRLQGNNPLQRIRIGRGAWIGANAIVMADVGQGAVVGAGAVVTKSVPDFCIAVGNPAHVIRDRSEATINGVARTIGDLAIQGQEPRSSEHSEGRVAVQQS